MTPMEAEFARMPHVIGHAPAGDVQICYRRFGRPGAVPVVIVHGLSFFSYDWVPVAAALARDRAVVAIDMRGFGGSGESPGGEYGLRRNGDDIIAVMDHLGWPRAVLVGHSMGGRICLLTAGWYPERVAGLCCLDFAPDLAPEGRRHVAQSIGRQPDVFADLDAALAYHGLDPAQIAADAPVRDRYRAFLAPAGQGLRLRRALFFRDKFRAVLDTGQRQPEAFDPWDTLRALDLPFLVLRGATSNLFAAETMDKVRAANPRADVRQIAGGHDLAHDNPAGVIAAVAAYLARHAA